MSIEKEYFNQLLPLGNTPASRAMTAVTVSPTGGVLNLDSVFGPTGGGGHFYEIKAMGVPSGHAVFAAMSPLPTYTIEPGNTAHGGATGLVYTGMGWPLRDGQSVIGRIPFVGPELSPTLPGYTLTGYRATLTAAPYLHYRTTHAAPTGSTLHVRRASIIPGDKAGDLGGFPIAGR